MDKGIGVLGKFIFSSRWLQAPLYVGLIIAQGVYVYRFIVELIHLITSSPTLTESMIMLMVLGLIDVVMIANLLIMVIIGGYEIFVSRLDLQLHPDRPDWLAHVSAGAIKVKVAMALIGISSIHLLKTFINAEQIPEQVILWQVIIHLAFLVSAIALAYTDRVVTRTAQEARVAQAARAGQEARAAHD